MKGRPRAYAPNKCLQTMRQFEESYILYSSIIFGRKKLYIDLLTPVMHKNDCGYDPDEDRVLVRRIGKGLLETDFEVDFTKTRGIFMLASEKQTKALDREEHLYLVLQNKGFDIVNESDNTVSILYAETTAELTIKLNAALAKEDPDYTAAAYYRDKIREKQTK